MVKTLIQKAVSRDSQDAQTNEKILRVIEDLEVESEIIHLSYNQRPTPNSKNSLKSLENKGKV